MRIIWKQHQDTAKIGTQDHVSRAAAEVLIATGQADAAPFSNYRERLAFEQSQMAVKPTEISWGIVENTRPPSVRKVVGDETFYYDGANLPADVPANIKRKVAELLALEVTGGSAGALEVALRKQAEYNASIAHAKRW